MRKLVCKQSHFAISYSQHENKSLKGDKNFEQIKLPIVSKLFRKLSFSIGRNDFK